MTGTREACAAVARRQASDGVYVCAFNTSELTTAFNDIQCRFSGIFGEAR
jgi:hypothetical protein